MKALKPILCALAGVLLMFSCARGLLPSQLKSVEGRMIPIRADQPKHPEDVAFLAPYKAALDQQMDQVIACAASRMEVIPKVPENKLSNFAVDMLFDLVQEQTSEKIDLALMNSGGLRAPIQAGEVRIRDIFNVFPFDNRLALVWVKGKDLRSCLPAYLKRPNGLSHARLKMLFVNGELQYQFSVNGKALQDDRLYVVATIDYLAEGNDGFGGLKNAVRSKIFEITLRDAALQYVKEKQASGQCLDAPLDGRVSIVGGEMKSDKDH